ncbi:hypothetical protein PI124_g4158 [Phytophthora idaei]|nr:hypothetical protein PI125_g3838 [Phytophthora idaei]KAG3165499.1 hypothetical protein PI126_g4619 [Phytophthora idaei]KAG3251224.1 hypothetical protein PI124_g4158 [Phytophthora idaei]
MQTRRRDVASLVDENQRLRAQLKRCDMARQQAERQVAELHQAETAVAQQLRQKEAEWMAEYDRSVQALLKIIKHHEDENEQLKTEVKRLRAAAAAAVVPPSITKMTRSTQTETPGPVKVAMRRNSVRFAREEEGIALNKEGNPSVDAKTKASIARMQQLFEQLHVSRDQDDSRSISRPNSTVNKEVDSGPRQNDNEHCSSESIYRFKAAVLGRLGEHQTEFRAVRRQQRVPSTSFEDTKIETQTDEIPIPNREMPSITLQKDLEERNRLLHKRLASQQKVLDQLLHTKLKDASSSVEQYDAASSTPSDTVREFSGNHQVEAQTNFEHSRPTEIPAEHPAQNGDMSIESADITERQPLSPPAA